VCVCVCARARARARVCIWLKHKGDFSPEVYVYMVVALRSWSFCLEDKSRSFFRNIRIHVITPQEFALPNPIVLVSILDIHSSIQWKACYGRQLLAFLCVTSAHRSCRCDALPERRVVSIVIRLTNCDVKA
jgi:hypothetical protein